MKVQSQPSAFEKQIYRLAAIGSFIWLVVILPGLALYNGGMRPFFTPGAGFIDFAQYYMGGSIVLANDYDSLYPEADGSIKGNLGFPEYSTPKPGYTQLVQEKQVHDSLRYILPPPSAFLFAPLALLSFAAAQWVWAVTLGLFIWLTCALSCQIVIKNGLRKSHATVWWLLMASSPLIINAIRIANCTPILTVALGLAALGLYKNRTALAVSTCILAGLLKGTSILFVPLILLMKRWSVIVWGIIAVILINMVAILMAGRNVYLEFFTSVYPSTRIVIYGEYNRSVYAFVSRLLNEPVLSPALLISIKLTGIALGTWLCARIWKIRTLLLANYPRFNAAVISLLGIYLIFSPYAWINYALCYFPFIPTLWNTLKHRWQKSLLAISFGCLWFPPTIRLSAPLGNLPEPLASYFLFGQFVIIALAISTLVHSEKKFRHTSDQ